MNIWIRFLLFAITASTALSARGVDYIYENQKEPLVSNLHAEGDLYSVVDLQFRIENDSAQLDYALVGYGIGKLSYPAATKSQYKIELVYNNRKIVEKYFDIIEAIKFVDTPEGGGSSIVKLDPEFTLPFYHHSQVINIYEGNELLFSERLSGYLCNENQQCEAGEDYLGCPGDCPSGGMDGFCDRVQDNRCDAECAEGMDLDCRPGEGEVIVTVEDIVRENPGILPEDPAPNITPPSLPQMPDPAAETSGSNRVLLAILAIPLLIIGLAILFFVLWRKTGGG